MLKLLFILFFVLLSDSVFSKPFTNQFIEFYLPPGWDCALEGTEWVCQSENIDRKKEAIIILAAKERGEQDSLEKYQSYLKQVKTYTLPGGKTQVSEPKDVKLRDVNGKKWVDSLHLASEVPGFYTQYLATTEESLGIAVTFSVGKDFYDLYRDVFNNLINSMRVFAPKKYQIGIKDIGVPPEALISDDTIPTQDVRIPIAASQSERPGSSGDPTTDYLIYGAIAAVVAIVLAKAKKKKKGGGKKKKKS